MQNKNNIYIVLLYLVSIIMILVSGGVWLLNSDYLPACKINILFENNTRQHISDAELRTVGANSQQGNFFKVNLNQLKGDFETIGWVEYADVRRIWPNTIEITLKEHQAIARWSDIQLVNDQGVLFEASSSADLPLFDGVENSENEMMDVFTEINPLFRRNGLTVIKLKRDQYSSWEITLNNGVLVKLGTEAIEKRATRFNQVWKVLLEQGHTAEEINYLDMRYKDGFVLKVK